jgi:uncharacterized protein (DUF697 family)
MKWTASSAFGKLHDMNKKKLPKAIRPTGADPGGNGPAPAAAWQQTPARPDMHSGDGKASAAMARPAAGPAQTGKEASLVAQQPASPDADAAKERRARAVKVVERASLWAGVAGLIPVPFVDLAAVGGVQIQMLRRISQIYDVPFSENRSKALIAGFAGTMIPASSGIGAASLIKGVPLVGTAISALTMPTLSVGATYAIGMAFIQHFSSGGTLFDFDPPDYHEFLKAEPRSRNTKPGAAPAVTESPSASQAD